MDKLFKSVQLSLFPWLEHGFGKCTFDIGELAAHGYKWAKTNQMHGHVISYLGKNNIDDYFEADAFVTNQKGIVCFVRTADCVPILLADVKNEVVAAVHAGWRGSAEHIVTKTIEFMKDKFSTNPAHIIAAIGPCICQLCYEVGDDVLKEFEKNNFDVKPYVEYSDNKLFLDLLGINLAQICDAGVCNYDLISQCTYENPELHSYRRDKDENSRLFNYIVIK